MRKVLRFLIYTLGIGLLLGGWGVVGWSWYFTVQERICLATNVYWEAGGESMEGKEGVAYVTFARARDKSVEKWGGDTICEVVQAKNQFSWTNDPQKLGTKPSDSQSWEESFLAADKIQQGYVPPGLALARFYLNPKTAEADQVCWFKKNYAFLKSIGNHDYYRLAALEGSHPVEDSCMPSPRPRPKSTRTSAN